VQDKSKPALTSILATLLALQAGGCSDGSDNATCNVACDATETEDQCYARLRNPDSEQVTLATAIAERYMQEHPATDEYWDWTSGVLMFAMTELYRVTGDTEVRDYYKEYMDFQIEQGYRLFWSDSCPPALTALALLRESEDARYQKVVDDVLEYLRTAPRTEDGGISHYGAIYPTIWVDSLFMFGMVLNRQGELADDSESLGLMSEQLGIFSDVLQADNGLLVHADAWSEPFDTDIYWGRGNGWVTASLADYQRIQCQRGESDPDAMRMFRRQVDGVLATQDPQTGMWWTVMNRPGETYLETSATALFAYGMARGYRYGLLGQPELEAAKNAVDAVRGKVQYDDQNRPYITGISGPTDVSTFEQYASVPLEDDLNYGVGAVILALIETSGL
jgi:unsaturated rhamnogalacturonyl hydrolase